MVLAQAATDRFNKLSSDLALGHVRGDARVGWHVVDNDIDDVRQRQLLEAALITNRVPEVLNSLLPTHPQYGALRTALSIASPTDAQKINKIRLNMDRWRWLPRDLGEKYIIVNVPAFHATLVENGVTRWKHRAIAGAIKTPTPQLSVMATGVILNPWWEVPTSISKEVAGKPGYVSVKGKDGKVQRWRQPPGPSNALGQLKFVMYNPYNIYLHDTNARSRFNSQIRALSHGCVRTEHVLDLATKLLGDDNGEWTPEKIEETLASKKSKQANFVKPVPVHIVYFSVAALTDGTIVNYTDLYKRDNEVIAALLDGEGEAPGKASEKVAVK
jgi:murein L,D-transpeptidase YcbB/YkuD